MLKEIYKQAMKAANIGLPVSESEEFFETPIVKAADVSGSLTPLQMAYSEAIKNAAENLSNPKNILERKISPEELALMGTLYHGTPLKTSEFIKKLNQGEKHYGKYGEGLYTTPTKENIKGYVHTKNPNIVEIEDKGLKLKEISTDEWDKMIEKHILEERAKGKYDFNPDTVADIFRKEGYQGIKFPDKDITLIFDPKNIASRIK